MQGYLTTISYIGQEELHRYVNFAFLTHYHPPRRNPYQSIWGRRSFFNKPILGILFAMGKSIRIFLQTSVIFQDSRNNLIYEETKKAVEFCYIKPLDNKYATGIIRKTGANKGKSNYINSKKKKNK